MCSGERPGSQLVPGCADGRPALSVHTRPCPSLPVPAAHSVPLCLVSVAPYARAQGFAHASSQGAPGGDVLFWAQVLGGMGAQRCEAASPGPHSRSREGVTQDLAQPGGSLGPLTLPGLLQFLCNLSSGWPFTSRAPGWRLRGGAMSGLPCAMWTVGDRAAFGNCQVWSWNLK